MLFKTLKHDWLKKCTPTHQSVLFILYLLCTLFVSKIKRNNTGYIFLMKECVIKFFISNHMVTNPTKLAHTVLHSLSFSLFFFMPPPLGARGIMFSGCPSEAWNTLFWPVHGSVVHPTNRDRFTACPSVRPERFPGICRRTHGGNGWCILTIFRTD